jgi:predicted nucleic-acid-binding protein
VSGAKAFIDTSAFLRLLIKDDPAKARAVERRLRESKDSNIALYVLPVTILEIVWVAEKVYRLNKKTVRDLVEAILNTPDLKCPLEQVFRQALISYETHNIKFADAVLGCWGLHEGLSKAYTYDEKEFKKIAGLQVFKP